MKTELEENVNIAVVIPCFKVSRHITAVVSGIPDFVWRIYVIDDACPEGSGRVVEESIRDKRVKVLFHEQNQGVGAAVITGYQAALLDGAEIIVKIDGDGQMDTQLIPYFVNPILSGEADYTKGNRFWDLEKIRTMPRVRLFGNAVLSLMTKLSSGYWNLFDPTNGFTAIHANVCRHLPLDRISKRYFFETDILFRLNTLRAVVVDVPMDTAYGEEISNLKVPKIIGEFWFKHIRNFCKRIFYNYYLRDLSLASLELPIGLLLLLFGVVYGGYHWYRSFQSGILTSAGTVMLSAMPILMGIQLILAFVGYDIFSTPSKTQHASIKINSNNQE